MLMIIKYGIATLTSEIAVPPKDHVSTGISDTYITMRSLTCVNFMGVIILFVAPFRSRVQIGQLYIHMDVRATHSKALNPDSEEDQQCV